MTSTLDPDREHTEWIRFQVLKMATKNTLSKNPEKILRNASRYMDFVSPPPPNVVEFREVPKMNVERS